MAPPSIPQLEKYGLSGKSGFLPSDPPVEKLSNPYYKPWEKMVGNLPALIRSGRVRDEVEKLPVLSLSRLKEYTDEGELRRAYSLLSFITHAYIWGGEKPQERIPRQISIPYLEISKRLDIEPIATFAAVCLWNYKSIYKDEPVDSLENLATLNSFTGSLDESWFYLVSVAIEGCGAPALPLMLKAIESARDNNKIKDVTRCLQDFSQILDKIVGLLERMHESCEPAIFYHKLRPFLAGSKSMADAGLPNGIIYEDDSEDPQWRTLAGGSNAQSSLMQFFDAVLGIEHRPEGTKSPLLFIDSSKTSPAEPTPEGQAPPPSNKFLSDMRRYMPGRHRQFLNDVTAVANIRQFVEENKHNRSLLTAYDSCVAMLSCLRAGHFQIVARYIVIPSTQDQRQGSSQRKNLATASSAKETGADKKETVQDKKPLRGTGGSKLLEFLKQIKDETTEKAVDVWTKRLLKGVAVREKVIGQDDLEDGPKVGLAGRWDMGGLCQC